MTLIYDPTAPTGLIHNEAENSYFASGWLGSTAIKCYAKDGPQAFYQRYIARDPRWQQKQSKSLSLGSLVDAMIEGSEHSRFRQMPDEYLTASGAVSTNKESKAWQASMAEQGYDIAPPSLWAQAEMLRDLILANPCAAELIDCAEKQCVARMQHPGTGVPVQMRADFYAAGHYIADLKTTSEPDYKWYGRACIKWGYQIQAGLYRELIAAVDDAGRLPFYHIVVQSVFPYAVRVFEWDMDDVTRGWQQAESAMEGIAANCWNDAQSEPDPLILPNWQ